MSEYTDADVPMKCGECGKLEEGIDSMVQHLLTVHTEYTQQEAENSARIWADDVYEQVELENIERAEYFRRHGEDFFEPESDKDYGND